MTDNNLLETADTLDAGSVVLVLDVPVEEVPRLALHPYGEWVGEQLGWANARCARRLKPES